MTILLTGDWTPFGKDDYYRKFEVYNMDWPPDISLETLALTSLPFSGLMAVMRDRKKVVKVQGGGKPIIAIFNAAGAELSTLLWDSGSIVDFGWSSNCNLLCVREDGQVLVYNMFSKPLFNFSMGKEAQDTKVKEAKFFSTKLGTGVAVLTSANRVFLANCVKSVKDVKVRSVPEPPGNTSIVWTVICEDRHSKVLAGQGRSLYSLSEGESKPVELKLNLGDENYEIKEIAASSGYEKLAVMTDKGRVWIGSIDASVCFRIYVKNNCFNRPIQLLWCGQEAIALNWGMNIELVGLDDEVIQYTYDDTIYCLQETDCLRVTSAHSMDIIQKVPQVVSDIFKINSTSPGSYLLEASKQYQKKSHRTNEYLHLVKPKLEQAISQCVEAAGHEFNPFTQKMLMSAAQFGKIYLDSYDSRNYVTMIRILRCLNAVRNPKVGIPLTITQLNSLGLVGLMELLMLRRHHFLALELASFLQMPDSSKIQLHWASYKVEHCKAGANAESVARDIASKLGSGKDISYKDIANKAIECGKTELAIKLIDYEPRARLQIPVLLKLNNPEDTTALRKAIESGNTDMVNQVLHHMNKHMGKDKFQMKIRDFQLAQSLYLKYCRSRNKGVLRDVYTQEDNHKGLAEYYIRESYDPKEIKIHDSLLVAAKDFYKKAKMDSNVMLVDEELKLTKQQHSLEDKLKKTFVGLSLHDTVKALLTIDQVKLADKLRLEYKVSDRRYWFLRVEVLGTLNNWRELDAFAKVKKSPIGYEPFFDVCVKHNELLEARKYLPKIQEEHLARCQFKLNMYAEAAETAFNHQDIALLKQIQIKCDPELKERISARLSRLGK